jgi:hypothetical protein
MGERLTVDNNPEFVTDDWRESVGSDAHDLAGINLTNGSKNKRSSVEACT